MFPYFTVFGKTVGLYAICAFAGLAVCCVFATVCLKKIGLEFEDVLLILLVAVGGLLVGGHILYGATQYRVLFAALPRVKSVKSLWQVLLYCFGGGVFYGGFIGMFIALPVYLKIKRFENPGYIKDVAAVCVPLFHAFGRVGCFFGGCCYGIESSFGFTVYHNDLNPAINGVRRFPTPLLEAACNLLIFFILYLLLKKGRFKNRIVLIYMLIYPVARFFIEFLRGDEVRGFIGPLSTSQWISVILFAYAVTRLSVIRFSKKNEN